MATQTKTQSKATEQLVDQSTPQQQSDPNAVEHKIINMPAGYTNRLAAIMDGVRVPNVVQRAPRTGQVGGLWSIYIQGTSNAQKGITGAEVAQIMCARGYCHIWFQGKKIAAGTALADQPAAALVKKANAMFEFVKKPPTRHEFFQLMPKVQNDDDSGEEFGD